MKTNRGGFLAWIMPSLGNVVWLACFCGVIALGPRMMNIDGDLGRHLTIGELILSTRSIPTVDVFSNTMAGQPLTPHEWLAEVLFAAAWKALGLDGVVVLSGVVIATAFWLVYRQAVRAGGSLLTGLAITILAMGASSLHWLTRPHIFTFLMLAVWVEVLECMRAGKRWYWLGLPAIMLVWANLHGAFISGFMVWLIYGMAYAWERWIEKADFESLFGARFGRYYLAGGGTALIASLANPVGIKIWGTSLGYIQNQYLVGHTAEYFSPDFHNPATWPFLLLLLLSVMLIGLYGKRMNALDIGMLTAWTAMSLYSIRNVPLYAILAAPILARIGADLVRGWRFSGGFVEIDQRIQRVERSLRGAVWPVCGVIVVVAGFMNGARLDFGRTGNRFDEKVFPVAAVTWLEAHPQNGAVFNYFPWGGYLLYRSWPEIKVFIDGQTDFYGEALTRKYETAITAAPGWETVLDDYQVKWAILPPGEALTQAMRASGMWKVVYEDKTAIVLIKEAR